MAKEISRRRNKKRVLFATRDEAMDALKLALENGRRTLARARATVARVDAQLKDKPRP